LSYENNGEKELPAQISILQKEIDRLKKSVKEKKFGLVWIEVPEKFDEECENKLPILKEVPEKAVINKDEKPTHILIEGDNYHALTCLNYTHKGKIDVIYIDPPYNTGAKDWKYNNKYVEENDPWKHSNWVNFMSRRLSLAKNLLKNDGVICVTIDDYEMPNLWLLMEDIYGEDNHLGTLVIRNNPKGRKTERKLSLIHEYALFFGKSAKSKIHKIRISPEEKTHNYKQELNGAWYLPVNLRKQGVDSLAVSSKGKVSERYYPIYYDSKTGKVSAKEKLKIEILPIDSKGQKRIWRRSKDVIDKMYEKKELWCQETANGLQVYFKFLGGLDGEPPQSIWLDSKYSASEYGTQILDTILGKREAFPYPKSPYAVLDCIKIATNNESAFILDFFAGSGTTVQAVIELNKQEGGRRQCIVCTNNENKICEEITYPRIEKVINGYPFKGKENELLYEKKITVTNFRKANDILAEIEFIKLEKEKECNNFETQIEDNHIKLFGIKDIKGKKEGLGGSLKYYKTAFIGKNNILKATDEDKIELAHQAGDLLSLAENTLYKERENKFWQLYKNGERFTAVYFREELDKFDEFVEMVEKLKCPTTVYVFSWGDEEFAEEFEHIDDVKVKTIPLSILEIYKNIYSAG
jgi:adenine specific DNA methylase Mod